MTLRNLLKIGKLDEFEVSDDEIRKLIEAARRSLDDARNESISPETRFEAAWRSVIQISIASLWACGYRPSTSTPGHHQTTIQSLSKTVGIESTQIAVLDRLRAKRNAIGYTGEDMDIASVEACINAAEQLLDDIVNWLPTVRAGLE